MTTGTSDLGGLEEQAKLLEGLTRRVGILQQQIEMLHRARLEGRVFDFGGQRHPYFCHRANHTYSNERAVELPIAWAFVKQAPPDARLLEIGNVLCNYFPTSHEVLDKYEQHPKVTFNKDVLEFEPAEPLQRIVSVSTLEHVGRGRDGDGPMAFEQAVIRAASWLAPQGKMLVTVPLGYNPGVEDFLERNETHRVGFLKRESADNLWRECTQEECRGTYYGRPYPFANAIAVLEIEARA
ncbi:MAG: hypothetical protein MSC31_03435 [Solirubrobacteraceae bacterium MAG38_C4-C5]|nr:hypothetical protein [Candidatus Siliceabacter maunaloa]